MDKLKSEIKKIKIQILIGVKEDKIDYAWGNMIIDTLDDVLNIQDIAQQNEHLACNCGNKDVIYICDDCFDNSVREGA